MKYEVVYDYYIYEYFILYFRYNVLFMSTTALYFSY